MGKVLLDNPPTYLDQWVIHLEIMRLYLYHLSSCVFVHAGEEGTMHVRFTWGDVADFLWHIMELYHIMCLVWEHVIRVAPYKNPNALIPT